MSADQMADELSELEEMAFAVLQEKAAERYYDDNRELQDSGNARIGERMRRYFPVSDEESR